MMNPVAEAALEVLVAGTEFSGLRRALFAAVAGRHLKAGSAALQCGVAEGECRLPLEVLLERLPTRPLATVATINKGRTGIKDALPGPYPLVVTAEERGTSDHFDFEGPGVMIPMVSSTGHGDASLKRVHFQDGQYAVGSILSVVQPRDPEQLSARYLHAYLSSFKDELLVSRMVGTANVSLTVAKIGDVPVPLLPIGAQRKVDELMALCDRLEARQQDAEAAHARLVQALLDSLTQVRDADEFQSCWQRVAGQFDTMFITEASVESLGRAVMALAIKGRLVAQVATDDLATSLLERTTAMRSGGARQPVIARHSIPPEEALELPAGWIAASVADVAVCRDGERVPVSQVDRERRAKVYDYYGASGVIDKIDGFLFDKPLLLVGEDGANLINRSSPIAFIARGKYWVNNHAHVLDACSETVLAYLALYFNAIDLKPYVTGTAQPKLNQAKLNAIRVALPPESEQARIVAKVTELLALCDQLRTRIAAARAKHAQLAEALVAQATH